jgi:heme peroxidase
MYLALHRIARQAIPEGEAMAGQHSRTLRGLAVSPSPLFQGRFGRMFRNLPAATYGNDSEKHLTLLGKEMSNTFDKPKDGRDDEESGIPALYTYFGQFIDHDITFDPMSSLVKQNDPAALIDFRNAALDLDNVYGRGPDDQPYMYDGHKKFLHGEPISGGHRGARDLPRGPNGRALIGDPRNDENRIVSQLQGLFLHFHNRLVDDYPSLPFSSIQQLVRFHYQYVILNDFLPRIVSAEVLEDLKTDGQYERGKLKFYHWKNDPFMPVEFSVAAYRLGHSMVRPGYRMNDGRESLLPIFPDRRRQGLTGFRKMGENLAIDWGRMIDIDTRAYDGSKAVKRRRLQFAYRIDTSLVHPLSKLPAIVASNPSALAVRNLVRSTALGLPSGQDVARAMGITPLGDKEILIGQGVDKPDKRSLKNIVQAAGKVFAGNCPLWTYVLAEAMHHKVSVKIPVKEKDMYITTPQLGPVGGRIVAEVFLGLMFGDNDSMLQRDPLWQPKAGKDFALKDIVTYALDHNPEL